MAPAAVTDSVRVACPAGSTAEAVAKCYGKFGEIASVKVKSGPRPMASITFFDVRAASLAIASSAKCKPAPVSFTGRAVQVPGSLQVDEADYERICNVKQGASGGNSYDIDFFDVRDADRYRAKVEVAAAAEAPEGLVAAGGAEGQESSALFELPPGLELPLGLEPPPGLERLEPTPTDAPAAAATGFTVEITGLPNMMLSDMMLETILQQAGLEDDVLSCTSELGKEHGKAVLQLASIPAIECCKRHFNGRQWHPTVPVNVVVPVEEAVAKALLDPTVCLAAPACAGLMAAPSWVALSADAPAFQPAGTQPKSSGMSAAAPVFVPGGFVAKAAADLDSSSTKGPGSESSTEAGDSEAEDEKFRPEETMVA